MFENIDKLMGRINKYRPLTSGEVKRLRDEFLIDFTYNSNAIEGNTLTLQETALVLQEGITIGEKPLKEHLEAIGHKEAFYYVEELVKSKMDLSEKVIKDIHSIVLMDKPQDKGVYRRIPVIIQGAIHKPPQPYLVPVKMEQLTRDYKTWQNEMHIIKCISLFHLKFEGVHPFIDGNGRTGRLVLNLELMKKGYHPINIKFKDRRRYYDCFADYFEHKTPDKMVKMVEEYLEEELKKYIFVLETANNIIK